MCRGCRQQGKEKNTSQGKAGLSGGKRHCWHKNSRQTKDMLVLHHGLPCPCCMGPNTDLIHVPMLPCMGRRSVPKVGVVLPWCGGYPP